MRTHHFIVLMNDVQWRVVHMQGKKCSAVRQFDMDANSLETLLQWWQQYAQAAVSFVSDHETEQYHVEVIPHVRGAAGRQLLQRKLASWPYARDLYTACQLERTQSLRLEDRMLFIAITCPALSAWLPTLAQHAIRLNVITTQAVLLACWLPSLMPIGRQCLCIQHTCSRLRVSYLYHDRLFFSQVLGLPVRTITDTDQYCLQVADQLGQVYLYLRQQQWLDEGQPLQVLSLGQPAHGVHRMQQYLPFKAEWVFRSEDEIDQALGGHPALPLQAVDWATVSTVLSAQPVPNLSPNHALLPDSLIRTKRQLHQAGVVLASMLIFSSVLAWQAQQDMQLDIQRMQHALEHTPRLDLEMSTLTQVQTLMHAVQDLQVAMRLPDRALRAVQPALHGMRYWQVVELAWQSASEPSAGAAPSTYPQETMLVTLKAQAQGELALQEWLQTLAKLKNMPEFDQVEVITALAAAVERKGSTTQLPASDQPVILKLRMHAALPGADA